MEPTSGTQRVLLAGAGKMATEHARGLQALGERVRIVGVVDPSERARQELLGGIPDAVGGDTLSGLVEDLEADVVHVCTPMETHAVVVREALEAGCHVYVEKPVTPTTAELGPLLDLAEEKNLKLCAGHQVLFEHPYRRLLELLPTIGDPVHVESYFSFHPARTSSGSGRPLTEAKQLVDVLPHPTYLLLDLLERAEPSESLHPPHLELSHGGTVHGVVRRGGLVGSLVVSLEARPVEHWLRVHGTRGAVHADFVRGSVQDLVGPGASGIEKAWNPFRLVGQLLGRNSLALARRIRNRKGSYSGLAEIFDAFYASIENHRPSPTSANQVRGTVQVCEEVGRRMDEVERSLGGEWSPPESSPTVLVTGGTGLLGREVSRLLVELGVSVRVVSRRLPPKREWISGVEYMAADLGSGLPDEAVEGIRSLIHCAAETSGGWEEHQRNSVVATERLLEAAARCSVETFVQVSSVGVLETRGKRPLRDDSPLHPNPQRLGPYVWGKLESERAATEFGKESAVRVKVLRPVPLVDWNAFGPPGRLGRRIGNLFVAVGRPKEPLVVADPASSARAIVAAALRPEETSDVMNLVPEEPPTRRDLVNRLRETNPEIRTIWLPRAVLRPLSCAALLAQRVVRPGQPAVRLADAFAAHRFEPGQAARWMSEEPVAFTETAGSGSP